MNVTWNQEACCHSGNCVQSLPDVFVVGDGGLEIRTDKASTAEIQKVCDACPGKALTIDAD